MQVLTLSRNKKAQSCEISRLHPRPGSTHEILGLAYEVEYATLQHGLISTNQYHTIGRVHI